MEASGWVMTFWQWLVLGLLLMLIEVLVPSTYFLWIGLAAMSVGVLFWLMPSLSFDIQLVLFALLSVSMIFLGKRYLKRHPIATDRPTLNVRGAQLIGRMATLKEPIVNGVGRVHLDDTQWKVLGDDMAAGSRVRVTAVEGISLRVELIEAPSSSGTTDTSSNAHHHDSDGDSGGGD